MSIPVTGFCLVCDGSGWTSESSTEKCLVCKGSGQQSEAAKHWWETLAASLSARNGDVVFFRADVIDLSVFETLQSSSPDQDDVMFVAVYVKDGDSIKDSILKMSPTEKQDLLKVLAV